MTLEPARVLAILSLRPGAEFSTHDDVIVWADKSQTQPTEDEINAEIVNINKAWDAKEYQRKRAIQYPNLAEQLDMQYWDQINGTTKWKEAVAKVKSDNPKP
tara:strand:+ start:490 stop:795 length:306 start_codon:yes stop_codon:yes gene_type:complete